MDISTINNISSDYIKSVVDKSNLSTANSNEEDFDKVFKSALNMVNETNDLQNNAETEEIKLSLGYSDSTHDLTVAQEKANVALQYTVAVRDKALEAYKEIMNMQM